MIYTILLSVIAIICTWLIIYEMFFFKFINNIKPLNSFIMAVLIASVAYIAYDDGKDKMVGRFKRINSTVPNVIYPV